MTQVNGAGQQPAMDPTMKFGQAKEADQTKKTENVDQQAPASEPTVAETAEKVAETVTPGAEQSSTAEKTEQAPTAESTEQTAGTEDAGKSDKSENTENEESSSYFSSFSDAFAGASKTTGEFFGNITDSISTGAEATLEALSYESLQQTGGDALDRVGDFVGDCYESLTTSTPVETASSWINAGAEKLSSGYSSAKGATYSHWLPVSAAAVGVFTAVKAGQAAKSNYSEGNFKRAATHILVGTSAAAFAGMLAYQSGCAQAAGESMKDYYNSFSANTEEAAGDA